MEQTQTQTPSTEELYRIIYLQNTMLAGMKYDLEQAGIIKMDNNIDATLDAITDVTIDRMNGDDPDPALVKHIMEVEL